ncbi:MAG: hypothetical protein AABZ55_16080 [Bdellovibrionota bacterium]
MMKSIMTKLSKVALAAFVLASMTGCKQDYIDKVTVKPSDDLTVLRVALVFTKNVKFDLAAMIDVSKYGTVFMDPYTETTPFEIGFNLNTDIVNDQDYVHLMPTTVLPNGMPIGLPNPVVEIRPEHPISDKFDLYTYVDVLKLSWVGVSGTFHFLSNDFPAALQLNATFLPDNAGNPGIMASVFGPTTNADGTISRPPGVAVFANIRQLVHGKDLIPGKMIEIKPSTEVISPIPMP